MPVALIAGCYRVMGFLGISAGGQVEQSTAAGAQEVSVAL